MGDSTKHTQLDVTVADIQRRFGPNAVTKLGQHENAEVLSLPTGFAKLDAALGIGGVPRGHVTELIGTPTSGVGTLSLKLIASAHAAGDMAVYLDLSHTFDADYAVRCGIALRDVLIVRPHSSAEALDIAYSLVSNRSAGVIIYDAAFVPREMPNPASVNRLLAPLAESACAYVWLSAASSRPSSVEGISQAALRLHLQREHWLKRSRDVRGYRVRVTILKNRFSSLRQPVRITIGFSGAVAGDGV
jgi:recombination protein RecA